MKKHPFDMISFGSGALLLAVVVVTVNPFSSKVDQFRWLLPTVLFIVGLSVFAVTVRSILSNQSKS